MTKKDDIFDIIIIGAGPAGIGMGIFFEKSGIKNYKILERDKVGASFINWPSYTRFISPSFSGNFFNAVDLNAITPDTSPAFTLKTEHPNGKEYAQYLELLVNHFKLKISEGTTVESVQKEGDVFLVETDKWEYKSHFVIWAGGEFSNPADVAFEGSDLCVHSSVAEDFPDDEYTIIGGYESGMELAAHLLKEGKLASVIDANEPWEENGSDSSISLAPATRDRLKPFIGTPNLRLYSESRVAKVEQQGEEYKITMEDGAELLSPTRPILATGYNPLPSIMEGLFEQGEHDNVILTENDESTITPGLFLVGPSVRHRGAIFCFIYKFRQRFPIVAETIAQELGVDIEEVVEEYKKANMYLKDLACCTDECTC